MSLDTLVCSHILIEPWPIYIYMCVYCGDRGVQGVAGVLGGCCLDHRELGLWPSWVLCGGDIVWGLFIAMYGWVSVAVIELLFPTRHRDVYVGWLCRVCFGVVGVYYSRSRAV